MRNVDQGLGTIGLICLAVLLAVSLCVLLPVVKSEPAVHASDWFGFSGNVIGGIIGGAMTLIAATVAWRGVKHQVQKQVELAAKLLEQDRAAVKAGVYAEIADRAARCMNDYLVPWKTWPKTRRLDPEIRKFAPTAPVVLPGVAGKLGLLDAETLPARNDDVAENRRDKLTRRANHFGLTESCQVLKLKYFAFPEARTMAYQSPSRPDKRGVS